MGRELHRTTIDIEVDAYQAARDALGTRGYRDTINGALHEVNRIAKLRDAARRIRQGELDLLTPQDLEQLRAPRR
ncbi:MAG TPA: hypothetical protein VHE14_05740 [Solirubrobacteraceae bacterium]|nr:hypothetical protein [Solirubrobacteraceae bacterium]